MILESANNMYLLGSGPVQLRLSNPCVDLHIVIFQSSSSSVLWVKPHPFIA